MSIQRLDNHKDQAGVHELICAATGKVAWDVGANIGVTARAMATNFEKVVAFEPCAESYCILQDEAPENVEALPFAIGREDGEITLDIDEYAINLGELVSPGRPLPGWGSRLGSRTVPCRSLDSLLMHNDPPDFVKIDVEGSEIEVLEGGHLLFSKVRPDVVIEIHREEHGDMTRGLLPGYELVERRHGPYMKEGGRMWRNHFWMTSIGGSNGRA